jgi:hypothetical protein
MATRKKKESILKTAECPSLSGSSTLTYEIGLSPEDALQFRIVGNDGGGLFSKEWVLWRTLEAALRTEQPVTAGHLKRAGVCRGKSANTPGFLVAALLGEGLVEPREEGGYRAADSTQWLEAVREAPPTRP